MKIAICASGAQRFESNAITHMLRAMPAGAEVDYFCYMNPGDYTGEDELKAFVWRQTEGRASAVFAAIDPGYVVNLEFPHTSYPETNIENAIRMFYAIRRCSDLKTKHEVEAGFTYDVVIRARTDVGISNQFDLTHYLPMIDRFVLFPSGGHWRGGLNDQFAFSSSKNMDIYSSVYDHIIQHCGAGCPMHPETLVRYHLMKMGLPVLITPVETALLRF